MTCSVPDAEDELLAVQSAALLLWGAQGTDYGFRLLVLHTLSNLVVGNPILARQRDLSPGMGKAGHLRTRLAAKSTLPPKSWPMKTSYARDTFARAPRVKCDPLRIWPTKSRATRWKTCTSPRPRPPDQARRPVRNQSPNRVASTPRPRVHPRRRRGHESTVASTPRPRVHEADCRTGASCRTVHAVATRPVFLGRTDADDKEEVLRGRRRGAGAGAGASG